MKNSKVVLGMLVMALAFGFVLAGCEVGDYSYDEALFDTVRVSDGSGGYISFPVKRVTNVKVSLEKGKKVTITTTVATYSVEVDPDGDTDTYKEDDLQGSTVTTRTGEYVKNGKILTATLNTRKVETKDDDGEVTRTDIYNGYSGTEFYRLEGKSIIPVSGGTKAKSLDGEEAVIELELADDLSAEELEALGF